MLINQITSRNYVFFVFVFLFVSEPSQWHVEWMVFKSHEFCLEARGLEANMKKNGLKGCWPLRKGSFV